MHLPVKAHYATLAMLALAEKHSSGELLSARSIASEHSIPPQFLGQILQQLRFAALITSTRGANGGFQLSRCPDTISLAEVIASVCTASQREIDCKDSPYSEVVQAVWLHLEQQQLESLGQISLAELVARGNAVDKESVITIKV